MDITRLISSEQFRVYRIDSGSNDDLSNRNAGNLVGVLNYLDLCDDRLMACGDFVTAFDVRVWNRYDTYIEMTHGRKRNVSDLDSLYVGRRIENDSIWYSFPAGGFWEATKLCSIPLTEISTLLRTDEGLRRETTYLEQADCIEKLFVLANK